MHLAVRGVLLHEKGLFSIALMDVLVQKVYCTGTDVNNCKKMPSHDWCKGKMLCLNSLPKKCNFPSCVPSFFHSNSLCACLWLLLHTSECVILGYLESWTIFPGNDREMAG